MELKNLFFFVLMEIFSVRADCFFIPFFNDINSMVQR